MTFILQYGGDLKEGKAHEFQAWLDSNEKELANAQPPGVKYLGTYFAIYAEKGTGAVHTFLELDSYGAQDALAEAAKDADGVYGKLMGEMIGFFDQSSNNYTTALYKNATAATLMGDD